MWLQLGDLQPVSPPPPSAPEEPWLVRAARFFDAGPPGWIAWIITAGSLYKMWLEIKKAKR